MYVCCTLPSDHDYAFHKLVFAVRVARERLVSYDCIAF
jgi:hypothetical protein